LPGLAQFGLAAAGRLDELAEDSAEHLFKIAEHAPGGIADRIFAALTRAGVDTSRRWGSFFRGISSWLSTHKEYETALLADLSSFADLNPAPDSDGSWSLTDIGDLLTATGYQEVGISEFDRAFVYDSVETRRSWLAALADAYSIDKSAVASQAGYLQRASPDGNAVSSDWFVAAAKPFVEPSLSIDLDRVLTRQQQQTLLSCLEADSDWIAWAAAAVVVSLKKPPWNSEELFQKDMSSWPRRRAGLFYMVAILTAVGKRDLLLGRAATSDSADYRYAARMTVAAASGLDSDGSISEALCRDPDAAVRPRSARKAPPAPAYWTCEGCRAMNDMAVEDCPACDDGVRPDA
jgi:hypothetical protein